MTAYMAELDANSIVQRVIVCDDPLWPAANLGGTWVETDDPYQPTGSVRYCGPGYRWDATFNQFFPWSVDTSTGTLWVLGASWVGVTEDNQVAFAELTGLLQTSETVNGIGYVVFGGRAITVADQLALVEVLG